MNPNDVACLKLGISFPVGFTLPFAEGRKGIVDRPSAYLGENDPAAFDLIGELIAFLQLERGANRVRDRRPRLCCQLAGNHGNLNKSSLRIRKILATLNFVEV